VSLKQVSRSHKLHRRSTPDPAIRSKRTAHQLAQREGQGHRARKGPAADAAGGYAACLDPALCPWRRLGKPFADAKGLKGDPFEGKRGGACIL